MRLIPPTYRWGAPHRAATLRNGLSWAGKDADKLASGYVNIAIEDGSFIDSPVLFIVDLPIEDGDFP